MNYETAGEWFKKVEKIASIGFNPLKKSKPEDIHSFVLRLHLNHASGDRGTFRPQFKLDDVNQGTSQRMQSLDAVLAALKARIEQILESANSDPG